MHIRQTAEAGGPEVTVSWEDKTIFIVYTLSVLSPDWLRPDATLSLLSI